MVLHAALLAYKTVPGTKKLKKLVHITLQFLAMFLSLVGLWAVWKFHDEKEIDHLYTLHSWLGLSCIIIFSLQVEKRWYLMCSHDVFVIKLFRDKEVLYNLFSSSHGISTVGCWIFDLLVPWRI